MNYYIGDELEVTDERSPYFGQTGILERSGASGGFWLRHKDGVLAFHPYGYRHAIPKTAEELRRDYIADAHKLLMAAVAWNQFIVTEGSILQARGEPLIGLLAMSKAQSDDIWRRLAKYGDVTIGELVGTLNPTE